MTLTKRSRRGAAGLEVRLVDHANRSHPGVVENLSCSGMFVQTDADLAMSSPVRIEVVLPSGGCAALQATVVRVLDAELAAQFRGRSGVGLCFDDAQPGHDPATLLSLGQLLVNTRALAENDEVSLELHGDLASIPPRSLFCFLDTSRKTGRLVLRDGQQACSLLVDDGVIWDPDATTDAVETLAHLSSLLAWASGEFHFSAQPVARPTRPATAIAALLQPSRC